MGKVIFKRRIIMECFIPLFGNNASGVESAVKDLRYSDGKSEPTTPTIEVSVNRLEESEAYVVAPPIIFVSVLKGVRVVSSAIVPKTVNIVELIFSMNNKCLPNLFYQHD